MDQENKYIPGYVENKNNHKHNDSLISESNGGGNHEEGDSMFFSSLLMSDLKDKEKEKLALLANERAAQSPSGSKSNKNITSPISPASTDNGEDKNSFIAMVTKSASKNNNKRESMFSNDSSVHLENRITKELIKIERASSISKSKSKSPQNNKILSPIPPIKSPRSANNGASPWGFSNFVGQCFSFTQLNHGASHNNNNGTPTSPNNTNDLQRRLQSYITTLEKFKSKTRNLENKISKLNKTMDKQNEKIIELKLENKMIKNVYVNNEFKDRENDYDENMVNKKLINDKQWKKWSYIDVIHWICTLRNGRFKKYKSTLMVNMKLRNISGKHFARIDKSDLTYFYGIIDFDDVCDLYEQIEDLVANSYAD